MAKRPHRLQPLFSSSNCLFSTATTISMSSTHCLLNFLLDLRRQRVIEFRSLLVFLFHWEMGILDEGMQARIRCLKASVTDNRHRHLCRRRISGDGFLMSYMMLLNRLCDVHFKLRELRLKPISICKKKKECPYLNGWTLLLHPHFHFASHLYVGQLCIGKDQVVKVVNYIHWGSFEEGWVSWCTLKKTLILLLVALKFWGSNAKKEL